MKDKHIVKIDVSALSAQVLNPADIIRIFKQNNIMMKEAIDNNDSPMQERAWIDVQALERRALQLFMLDVISKEECKGLFKQLWSPDYENHVVADEIIKEKLKLM